MKSRETISELLRRRRNQLGLSLSEVARRAGTSPASLSRYENGWTRFETYTLRKLASALDCDLEVRLKPRRTARRNRASQKKLVEQLDRLFWDHDLKESDLSSHLPWVVERVLEYGNLEDVAAFRSYLGKKAFLAAVSQATRLSPRTFSFWQQILSREGIECTRKYSRSTAWNS